jgi:hypothetical protein
LIYNGINYFVNGGGSMTDTIRGSSDAELLWAGEGYSAFASASATKDNLTISFVNANKVVQYSYTLTNPLYPYIPYDSASLPTQSPFYTAPSKLDYTTFVSSITVIGFLYGGFIFLAAMIIPRTLIKNSKGIGHIRKKVVNTSILKKSLSSRPYWNLYKKKLTKLKRKNNRFKNNSHSARILPHELEVFDDKIPIQLEGPKEDLKRQRLPFFNTYLKIDT